MAEILGQIALDVVAGLLVALVLQFLRRVLRPAA
jgi:hypothetical protein